MALDTYIYYFRKYVNQGPRNGKACLATSNFFLYIFYLGNLLVTRSKSAAEMHEQQSVDRKVEKRNNYLFAVQLLLNESLTNFKNFNLNKYTISIIFNWIQGNLNGIKN